MQKGFIRVFVPLFLVGFCGLPSFPTCEVASAAEVDESKIDGLKCFIMVRKDVKGKKVFDYKDGKLFLCCSSCVKKMERDPGKYEAKANHQLVYTGQYKQHACPLSGNSITDGSPEFEVDGGDLGAVTVRVSSKELVDQLAAMELGEQIKSVFGPEGFEKGKFSAE
tara:strand:- start:320 stop:817 length:498 start_codon:yes stop_codon:yes gene_type:complete